MRCSGIFLRLFIKKNFFRFFHPFVSYLENEIPLLGSNSNMSVPSSVPPSSTILPFTATSIPTKDGDDIKNTPPFVSKEFEIRVSSPDNQQDPSDEDYVSNLIGNIEMPQHMPKVSNFVLHRRDRLQISRLILSKFKQIN